jgi:hypothetical protein
MRVLVLLLMFPTSVFAHQGYDLMQDQVKDMSVAELALTQPRIQPVVLTPDQAVQCLLPLTEEQSNLPAAYVLQANAACPGG